MKKKLLYFLLCGVLLIVISGCGSKESKSSKEGEGNSSFNYIIDELNTAAEESLERNDGVSVSTLEERFTQNLSSAEIIACGNKPFTKDVDLTQTSYTTNLNGYDGKIPYAFTKMTKKNGISYCLVMATNIRAYINVTVNYEKDDESNTKPVFSVPELLNQ